MQGTSCYRVNLEDLKFCQQTVEDLILFSKLATKNLTFLLKSEITNEKSSISSHADIGLISLQFVLQERVPT